MINTINNILLSKDIKKSYDILIKYIPEIKYMVDFEHKHPHHHLDVWNHTLKALDSVDSNDIEVLMALLLHDIGKPFSYQEGTVRHFHGHPKVSALISNTILKRIGYDSNFINNVVYLVEYHDTKIDVENINDNIELINKRLIIQYADAKAHAPNTVNKRIKVLDNIKNELESKQKLLLKNNNNKL